jgi:hypothetical protein
MNYLSSNRDALSRFPYHPENATKSVYNYSSNNTVSLDRSQSKIGSPYTIRPHGIHDVYPQPYETGECVSSKERHQTGFDIQHNDNMYSDIAPIDLNTTNTTQGEPEHLYPMKWGMPPKNQDGPVVILPPPYGTGTVVLRDWIIRNTGIDSKIDKK